MHILNSNAYANYCNNYSYLHLFILFLENSNSLPGSTPITVELLQTHLSTTYALFAQEIIDALQAARIYSLEDLRLMLPHDEVWTGIIPAYRIALRTAFEGI